jgi:alpha-glucosidase
VNSDLVAALAPPPDPRLFPDGMRTPWVRPGHAVWKYLDGGGENTLDTLKEFSRLAGQLGFEYHVVEGFWQRWSDADQRALIDDARQHGVGIWLWKHSRDLHDPEARRAFFAHLADIGAVGAKIDFLDHEAKEVIDLYDALRRDAAEHRLLVNFHGSNKPTGDSRTWPNELTREAVSGMERRSTPSFASHDVTLPFTRMLAGPMDFTPMLFGDRRKDTTWVHQIATAALFTSPLLTFGAHPRTILDHPAAEMIRSIPSVWDETRVLPASEMGEVAAFVRRRGSRWFVVVANGPTARVLDMPLEFLPRGTWRALLVHDDLDDPPHVRVESATARATDTLRIAMRAGGGFIGRFG